MVRQLTNDPLVTDVLGGLDGNRIVWQSLVGNDNEIFTAILTPEPGAFVLVCIGAVVVAARRSRSCMFGRRRADSQP